MYIWFVDSAVCSLVSHYSSTYSRKSSNSNSFNEFVISRASSIFTESVALMHWLKNCKNDVESRLFIQSFDQERLGSLSRILEISPHHFSLIWHWTAKGLSQTVNESLGRLVSSMWFICESHVVRSYWPTTSHHVHLIRFGRMEHIVRSGTGENAFLVTNSTSTA